MKAVVLMLAFLGIVSAGKLGHHHHSAGHGQSRPGRLNPSSGIGHSGTSPGQFGGQGTSPGQFGGQGVGTIPGLGQAVGPSSGEQPQLIDFSLTGIVTFDNHACVFRNGELRLLGPNLNVGESGDFAVQSGTATLGTGQTVSVDNGLLNGRILEPTDTQLLQVSLARAGITLDQFIQQTETLPPQQGIFVLTAGVISINGILKNIRTGVVVFVGRPVVDPNTGGVQPIGPEPAINPVDVQTVTVTETAAHETVSVTEPVILTKTQTQDEFVTITSPLYNSRAVTITNIAKQTVTVPEEQVIRSPVAGSIVVNTIPVSTQTVMTVSVRSTNMFVRTVTAIVTDEHAHFVTNYSISTATVNNPVTSTVVQTITQTSVSTVFNTSTVGSTIYTTTTATINIGTAGATQTSTAPGGGYY